MQYSSQEVQKIIIVIKQYSFRLFDDTVDMFLDL